MYAQIAAVLSLAGLASTMPLVPRNISSTIMAANDAYTMYYGNGSPGAGWPDVGGWSSYDELWAVNSAAMSFTCGWNNFGADNSPQEIADVGRAIQEVSAQTGVDSRFILSIVMQESKGCVRAPTTDNGVINPGLMQSHNGAGSCAGVNPCPYDTIRLMIQDGTAGTAFGDGLQQTYATASGALGDSGARAYYAAARLYNSGSVDYENLNNGFTSTACYSTDVANRLTGWILAPSGCTA